MISHIVNWQKPVKRKKNDFIEFSKLIKEMWTQEVRSVTPSDLKRAFSAKHRMYSDYNQQDAQEFLRFFLDSLHCALNTGMKGDHLRLDDNLRYKLKKKSFRSNKLALFSSCCVCHLCPVTTIKQISLGNGIAVMRIL